MGRQLSDDLLAGLRSQNDHGFILWDGVKVAVEYADFIGDENDNFLTGTQSDDNIFGNGGNDVLDDGDDNPMCLSLAMTQWSVVRAMTHSLR